eukprot:GFYU01008913.1.p1 GENE.GFYU01008913.1~~GFYU01008913.1.p1  ORF type:complete len:938 (-),score=176.78 GFYU01008913.1:171-2984(-)
MTMSAGTEIHVITTPASVRSSRSTAIIIHELWDDLRKCLEDGLEDMREGVVKIKENFAHEFDLLPSQQKHSMDDENLSQYEIRTMLSKLREEAEEEFADLYASFDEVVHVASSDVEETLPDLSSYVIASLRPQIAQYIAAFSRRVIREAENAKTSIRVSIDAYWEDVLETSHRAGVNTSMDDDDTISIASSVNTTTTGSVSEARPLSNTYMYTVRTPVHTLSGESDSNWKLFSPKSVVRGPRGGRRSAGRTSSGGVDGVTLPSSDKLSEERHEVYLAELEDILSVLRDDMEETIHGYTKQFKQQRQILLQEGLDDITAIRQKVEAITAETKKQLSKLGGNQRKEAEAVADNGKIRIRQELFKHSTASEAFNVEFADVEEELNEAWENTVEDLKEKVVEGRNEVMATVEDYHGCDEGMDNPQSFSAREISKWQNALTQLETKLDKKLEQRSAKHKRALNCVKQQVVDASHRVEEEAQVQIEQCMLALHEQWGLSPQGATEMMQDLEAMQRKAMQTAATSFRARQHQSLQKLATLLREKDSRARALLADVDSQCDANNFVNRDVVEMKCQLIKTLSIIKGSFEPMLDGSQCGIRHQRQVNVQTFNDSIDHAAAEMSRGLGRFNSSRVPQKKVNECRERFEEECTQYRMIAQSVESQCQTRAEQVINEFILGMDAASKSTRTRVNRAINGVIGHDGQVVQGGEGDQEADADAVHDDAQGELLNTLRRLEREFSDSSLFEGRKSLNRSLSIESAQDTKLDASQDSILEAVQDRGTVAALTAFIEELRDSMTQNYIGSDDFISRPWATDKAPLKDSRVSALELEVMLSHAIGMKASSCHKRIVKFFQNGDTTEDDAVTSFRFMDLPAADLMMPCPEDLVNLKGCENESVDERGTLKEVATESLRKFSLAAQNSKKRLTSLFTLTRGSGSRKSSSSDAVDTSR